MYSWHARVSFNVSVKGDVNFYCSESTMVLTSIYFFDLWNLRTLAAAPRAEFPGVGNKLYFNNTFLLILTRGNLIWFNLRIICIYIYEDYIFLPGNTWKRRRDLFYLQRWHTLHNSCLWVKERLKVHVGDRAVVNDRDGIIV